VAEIADGNPASGVPRLTVECGSLASTDAKALEGELAGQHEQLSRKPDGEAGLLRGKAYRLQELLRETRMLELLLEQFAAESGGPAPSRAAIRPVWVDGFLAALDPLTSQPPDPRDPHAHASAAFCLTLDELRALGRTSPDWLAFMLTGGYPLLRQDYGQDHDPSRGNFYALALGELGRPWNRAAPTTRPCRPTARSTGATGRCRNRPAPWPG